MTPDAPVMAPGGAPSPEKREVVPFLPTPERVSQFFEMDVEKVRSMYKSTEERMELVDTIMSEKEELSAIHDNISRDEMEYLVYMAGERMRTEPDVSLEKLEEYLVDSHNMLKAKHDFREATSPQKDSKAKEKVIKRVKDSKEKAKTKEKKTLWQHVWDTVTWLPRKHPIIFTLLALAGTAWGLSALWEYLYGKIVIPSTAAGAASVAGELTPVVHPNMTAIPSTGIGAPDLSPLDGPSLLQPPYTPPGGVPQPFDGPLAHPIEVPPTTSPASVQDLLDAGDGGW